jgi:arylsulfatase A-like enzyme
MKAYFTLALRYVFLSTFLSVLLAATEFMAYAGNWFIVGKLDGRYLASVGSFFRLYATVGMIIGLLLAFGSLLLSAALSAKRTARGLSISSQRRLVFCTFSVAATLGFVTHHLRYFWDIELDGFLALVGVLVASVLVVIGLELSISVTQRNRRLKTTAVALLLGYCLLALVSAVLATRAFSFERSLETTLARLSEQPTPTEATSNVLLVTIDTLRADHLSIYGYTSMQTSGFDQLAAEGVIFENMIAQSSWTRPSFGSIWTSLYPSQHRATRHTTESGRVVDSGLRSDLVTLPQLMTDRGFLTVGLNTNPHLDPSYGFGLGFQHYLNAVFFDPLQYSPLYHFLLEHAPDLLDTLRVRAFSYLPADKVFQCFEKILGLLGAREQGFFFWVHFMDPHSPYHFRRDLTSGERPPSVADWSDLARFERAVDMKEFLTKHYDSEVAYVDRHLVEILEELRAKRLLDETLVVVTSDHGEEFFDHGGPERAPARHSTTPYYRGLDHGHTMYDELIRVPLAIRFPKGKHAGQRVDRIAQHIDLLPTLLDYVGVMGGKAQADFEGTSLLRYLDGSEEWPRRYAFSEANQEGPELKQCRSEQFKLIYHTADERIEFYDLVADPAERNNRFGKTSESHEAHTALGEWMNRMDIEGKTLPVSGEEEHRPAVDEQLRALGYQNEDTIDALGRPKKGR